MTLRGRALAALLAGLAAGLVVLGLATLRLHGGAPNAQGRGEKVLELDPARVVGLAVEGGEGPLRLARTGFGWVAVEPAPREVDARRVAALLDRLVALRRRATLASPAAGGAALSPYGLDAPRLRLTLALDDGRAEKLAFGGGTGEDGAAFVSVTDGAVVVVAADASAAIEADLAALRAAIGGGPPLPPPTDDPPAAKAAKPRRRG